MELSLVHRVALVSIPATALGLPCTLQAQPWLTSGSAIYYNAGNVGIGTSTPAHKLHVATPSTTNGARAVYGVVTGATGFTNGVVGETRSTTGRGVFGLAQTNAGPNVGVLGQTTSPSGRGVFGLASSATGTNVGLFGQSNSPNGYAGWFSGRGYFSGFLGLNTTAPAYRLHVVDPSTAIAGFSTAASGTPSGVRGESSSPTGSGVFGKSNATTGQNGGVLGVGASPTGAGVGGYNTAQSGDSYGVTGRTSSLSIGWAIFGFGDIGSSGVKSFRIDHPLDPENKYLTHFCAESPEPVLIYRGTAILGPEGDAWVQLPDYFESLNRDIQYQLTAVGAPAPMLHVAAEVTGNRFRVAGGTPGLKVCWTVTGTRDDPYVRAYGKPAEQLKSAEQRGKYLNPELFGQSEDRGIAPRPSPVPDHPAQ